MLLLHKELMILIINKVEICGVNTSKLPVIKEKKELIIKMREGDKKARETFIQGNLRLVLSVIQRFNNRGEIMLRLSTPGHNRVVQSDSFCVNYGGGEANVAVSLANYGDEAYFVSKVPATPP